MRRLWEWRGLVVAVAALAWGLAVFQPHDLLDADRSAANSHGEDVLVVGFVLACGLAGLLARAWPAGLPRRAFAGGLLLWVGAWAAVGVLRDPAWAPSGIDWHDSLLGAYALAYDDPPLYCAARYPLYPALGAALHPLGLSLDLALQLVSRLEMLLLGLPLAWVARRWFGEVAALATLGLLVCVPTFHHHLDAVTPYPTVMLAAATAVASLVAAVGGGLGAFALAGLALGALLAAEAKALLVAGLLLPLGMIFALAAPAGAGLRAWGRRGLRLLLLLGPIAGSYAWAGSLPVRAETLESLASPTLFPPTWSMEDKQPWIEDGYLWGHFHAIDQPLRSLDRIRRLRTVPGAEQARLARQRGNVSKLAEDYPGTSPRPLWLAALGLLSLPLRRLPDWRGALRGFVELLPLVALALTALPSLTEDYQDRYVCHALVWLPLGIAGFAEGFARLVVPAALPRLFALSLALGAAAAWPGFSLSAPRIWPRLEPVLEGGEAEQAVRDWADAQMAPGDALLDTTWLMMGALVAGDHTVLRQPGTWPPGGAATPSTGWRASRPAEEGTGTLYALGALAGEPPPPAKQVYTAGRLAGDASWIVAWSSPEGRLQIWRFAGRGRPAGVPAWWLPDAPAVPVAAPAGPPAPAGPALPTTPQ